jgi:hypothetical protein
MRAAGPGLAAVLLLLGPAAAPGAGRAASALVRCACDPSALLELRDEIASAGTPARAQQLATAPLEAAREALARARRLVPGSTELVAKERQLRGGELAVAAAATPEAVADAFVATVGGPPARAAVDAHALGCSYSTGEIIAIVLGFILGIIPGIILLIILC